MEMTIYTKSEAYLCYKKKIFMLFYYFSSEIMMYSEYNAEKNKNKKYFPKPSSHIRAAATAKQNNEGEKIINNNTRDYHKKIVKLLNSRQV
jgi:ABC-type proline/glycine betaine transport system substrate-binding protein